MNEKINEDVTVHGMGFNVGIELEIETSTNRFVTANSTLHVIIKLLIGPFRSVFD